MIFQKVEIGNWKDSKVKMKIEKIFKADTMWRQIAIYVKLFFSVIFDQTTHADAMHGKVSKDFRFIFKYAIIIC